MTKGVTVIDVCRKIGIEPKPALTWSVGNQVRHIYETRTGELPPKALRQKTGGGGSHCFAVYPAEMAPEIEKIIRQHEVEAARQPDLFGVVE